MRVPSKSSGQWVTHAALTTSSWSGLMHKLGAIRGHTIPRGLLAGRATCRASALFWLKQAAPTCSSFSFLCQNKANMAAPSQVVREQQQSWARQEEARQEEARSAGGAFCVLPAVPTITLLPTPSLSHSLTSCHENSRCSASAARCVQEEEGGGQQQCSSWLMCVCCAVCAKKCLCAEPSSPLSHTPRAEVGRRGRLRPRGQGPRQAQR